MGVRRKVGVVGTLLQSIEERPVGESKGFDFSPPFIPGFGVVSPLGIQNLSINEIISGERWWSGGRVARRRKKV